MEKRNNKLLFGHIALMVLLCIVSIARRRNHFHRKCPFWL